MTITRQYFKNIKWLKGGFFFFFSFLSSPELSEELRHLGQRTTVKTGINELRRGNQL